MKDIHMKIILSNLGCLSLVLVLCGCVSGPVNVTLNVAVDSGMVSNILSSVALGSTNAFTGVVHKGPSWLTSVLTSTAETTGLPQPALIGTIGSAAVATLASLVAGLVHRKRKLAKKKEKSK